MAQYDWMENSGNATFWDAHRVWKATRNDLIDFNTVIWREEVEVIDQGFKEHGITEFTISGVFGNLMKVLQDFQNRGWVVNGMVTIDSMYDGKQPALLVRR